MVDQLSNCLQLSTCLPPLHFFLLSKFHLSGIFLKVSVLNNCRNSSIRKQPVVNPPRNSICYSDSEFSVLANHDFLSDREWFCDSLCLETLTIPFVLPLAQSCFNQYANIYLNTKQITFVSISFEKVS